MPNHKTRKKKNQCTSLPVYNDYKEVNTNKVKARLMEQGMTYIDLAKLLKVGKTSVFYRMKTGKFKPKEITKLKKNGLIDEQRTGEES